MVTFHFYVVRTVRYYESFVPSTIKLWNDLSLDISNSQSILIFKVKLRSHFSPSDYNKLFNYSVTRRLSVLHTRLRGRLHGAFSTPGLNSALLTGLKFFTITWSISTPGLKRYTIRSRHRFAEVKKPLFCFLVINSQYHVCSNNS